MFRAGQSCYTVCVQQSEQPWKSVRIAVSLKTEGAAGRLCRNGLRRSAGACRPQQHVHADLLGDGAVQGGDAWCALERLRVC